MRPNHGPHIYSVIFIMNAKIITRSWLRWVTTKFHSVSINKSVSVCFLNALLFLFWPYVLYNHSVLMLQSLWHLMAQAVRPCLGLRAASGRHMSFLLLYWLVFLSERNIIFISLHSEWQFLKIAPHQGIFITFCRPAWVARQLFISLHLSSISLSQKACFFSPAIFLLYFAMTFLLKLLGLCYSQFEIYRE